VTAGLKSAAGDVPDRVGHGHDREAEGQRYADETAAGGPERGRQDGSARAAEDEPERAEELRGGLLARPHA